ncbi:MAG: dicarboxylate/amino acid:cation symporter [Tannerellaceae bacterium]|jgi:Na+/H+-dicarboxylate symporter|nr:dicarboxylate/amino acid:cation symporter [Tannerellaceae bacterium]
MKTQRITTRIPLYLQILIGMLVGIIVGLAAIHLGGEQVIHNWIAPWGKLFIRLLQVIAVPLIFVTLVKGVTGLQDMGRFSRLGGRTLLLYLIFISAAVAFGIGMGAVVKPGSLVDSGAAARISEKYQSEIADKALRAAEMQHEGPLRFLDDIVPANITLSFTDNSKTLQVIFFAIFFACAALILPREKIRPVADFFDALNEIILRMVGWIIALAPVGVAALMAELVASFGGNGSIFAALALYALTVALALLIIMYVFYPIVIRFMSPLRTSEFVKAMYPVQLFAFTTSSSAVTLPVTMDAVENKLGVSKEVSSFVLPVGVTINMDGTSCYQAIATLFIAQALGVDLGWMQIVTILLMTILSSIGTPGIPGGSYVILAMVLTSVGIPPEGLALIIGLDRPLDMLRTAVNVTGDAVVACMIHKQTDPGNKP